METTSASDLTAFLSARLDEDEAAAKELMPFWTLAALLDRPLTGMELRHIARHDPARVLLDVKAKRAILERYERGVSGDLPEWKAGRELIEAGLAILLGVLRDLAAVYSDHPDYRPEWRP